ncbi:uncharacterized protein E5676_scaffold344G00440 [Cucumis melo var. makuwa]|uniref:Uncharacterized protein n=1 Tax=Cucumis melo var. makuwa TaxID=1194695 RepID=A0A5D3E323_CUCMM|nr:uncharacterized protein E5676_scaffold344G00440 [Cucumis melo var. makuwa]
MTSQSIDTLDDANDHDTEEENRQVLEEVEIEDLTIEKQDKDGTSCRLVIGTKDNVVGVGTIFDYDMDGDNVKVSVEMVADNNCFVSVLTREGTLRICQMHPISTQCIDAFMFHLYRVMEEKGMLGSYKFTDIGSVSVGISKEDQAQVLNARLHRTDHRQILMFPYNLGAFDISRRKKPLLRIIKCLKQGCIMECGYYVIQFMHDIILSSNRTIVEVMEGSASTYSQDDLDVLCCVDYPAVMVVIDDSGRDEGGGKSMFRFINDLGSGEGDGW